MRKLLAVLAVCAAAVIPGAVVAAPAVANSCTWTDGWNVNQQVSPPYSQTWFHSWSGCGTVYPIQYNRTDCLYPRVSGDFWANGPTVHGGYSTVSCGAHPYGWIEDVWMWTNAGSGWSGVHVYHFYA